MNYESRWVGALNDAIVSMDKVIALRKPSLHAELKKETNDDYFIAIDVARSKSESNNQSAIIVGKIIRNKVGSVKSVDIVNIIVPPNGLNFTDQAIILKRMQKQYKAIAVIVDSNGLGKGLCDRLVEEIDDRDTGETYEAWDCINDETFKSKIPNSPKLLFSLNSTSINTNIIVNFWDYVETKRFNLLPSDKNAKINDKISENDKALIVSAHMRTDQLLEQLSNLEVEIVNGKTYKVKQTTKRIDKDIYSALVYLLYYVQNYENNKTVYDTNYLDYLLFN